MCYGITKPLIYIKLSGWVSEVKSKAKVFVQPNKILALGKSNAANEKTVDVGRNTSRRRSLSRAESPTKEIQANGVKIAFTGVTPSASDTKVCKPNAAIYVLYTYLCLYFSNLDNKFTRRVYL